MVSSVVSRSFSPILFYLLLNLHRLFVHSTTVDLNWVSSNPLFLTSGLRMLRREVRINDRIRFGCSHDGTEHIAIHRVSEREAFSCERLSKFTDALVGTCTKANDSVIIRLREFPMLPNELSYKPNHDYYFISTSTGTIGGLENSQGGLCASRKMRIQIHVRPRVGANSDRAQLNSDDSFPVRERVMVLPVDSRQYPVPVMYVPVSTANEQFQNDGDRRLRLPYHLYVPNSQLQRSILDNARIADRRGDVSDATVDYPYRAHVVIHDRSSVMHDGRDIHETASRGDRFDAQDEPLRPFEAPGIHAYPRDHHADQLAKPTALRSNEERDFEVEYVDSPSRGCHSVSLYSLLLVAILFTIIDVQHH